MPEGFRNAGCTFNRTISMVLDTQLDRNISAYIDNVVVQSKKHKDHIPDLRETFANLRKHGKNAQQIGRTFPGHFNGKTQACRLHTLEGVEEPYSWNKDMLQRYYV